MYFRETLLISKENLLSLLPYFQSYKNMSEIINLQEVFEIGGWLLGSYGRDDCQYCLPGNTIPFFSPGKQSELISCFLLLEQLLSLMLHHIPRGMRLTVR